MQIILWSVVFVGIFLLARYYRMEISTEANDEPLSVTLWRAATQVNDTLPEMVSERVRLDKVTAGPGNSFNYVYTIVDDEAARNLSDHSDKIGELKAQLHDRVCSMMPDYRDNGTIVNYSLNDNSGAPIAAISINPADC